MSPSHTISQHLCRQIYTSWQQSRQSSQLPIVEPVAAPAPYLSSRRSSSPEKRSLDCDRSLDGSSAGDRLSRSPSSQSWHWGGR